MSVKGADVICDMSVHNYITKPPIRSMFDVVLLYAISNAVVTPLLSAAGLHNESRIITNLV